jgi:hypothetical protein
MLLAGDGSLRHHPPRENGSEGKKGRTKPHKLIDLIGQKVGPF